MNLILADLNEDLCNAWRKHFDDTVCIHHGPFEDVKDYDCIVSPANSYGYMTGGIDLAIARRFPEVQNRVQEAIAERWHGYLPVGSSIVVGTGDAEVMWCAVTPTMILPMPIEAHIVFNSMWAMLNAVEAHQRLFPELPDNATPDEVAAYGRARITTVVCPGLGTLTGCVPAEQAAEKMAMAWDYFRNEPDVTALDWANGVMA